MHPRRESDGIANKSHWDAEKRGETKNDRWLSELLADEEGIQGCHYLLYEVIVEVL